MRLLRKYLLPERQRLPLQNLSLAGAEEGSLDLQLVGFGIVFD